MNETGDQPRPENQDGDEFAESAAESAADAEAPSADPHSDEPSDSHSDEPSDELNDSRIRQLATLKKSAIRARSYALIGVVLAGVAVIKFVIATIEHVRAWGWGPLPIAYLLLACAAVMLTVHLSRRAIKLQREANVSAPLPPAPPGGPDFSTLSDGSQQWKNLEEIR